MKKSFRDFSVDLWRHPIRTLLIVLLFLAVYLFLDSAKTVVSTRTEQLLDTPSASSTPANPPVAASVHTGTTSIQLIPVKIEEKDANREISIVYPTFNILVLDSAIKGFISEKTSEIRFEDYDASLDGSFDTPFISTDIVSFKMNICTYSSSRDQGRCTNSVYGFSFDRQNNTLFTLEDVLNIVGLSLEQLSEKVKKQFPETANDEAYSDGFKPLRRNFSEFLVDNESVTFLFQQFQLGHRFMGTPEITIKRIR